MRRFLFLALAALVLVGCPERRANPDSKRDVAVGQSAANLKVLAAGMKQLGMAAFGWMVESQALVILAAQEWDPAHAPQATITVEEVVQQPQATAQKLHNESQKTIKELPPAGWWEYLQATGCITGLLAVGGIAWRALNLPGWNLIEAALKASFPKTFNAQKAQVADLKQKAEVLTTAVVSSDVGRWALKKLDVELGKHDEVCDAINKAVFELTGGEADTIEGLFVWAAKGAAVDEGKQHQIDALLKELRSMVDTVGGKPAVAAKLGV